MSIKRMHLTANLQAYTHSQGRFVMASTIATGIVEFVARERCVDASQLQSTTKLRQDLGLNGTDATEFLIKFGEEFRVDLSRCDLTVYFAPEGWDPIRGLWRLFTRRKQIPVTIADLIRSAENGQWTHSHDASASPARR